MKRIGQPYDQMLRDISAFSAHYRAHFAPFCSAIAGDSVALPVALNDLLGRLAIQPTADINPIDGVNFAMLSGGQLCDAVLLLAIYHNAFITADLADEAALNDVLEQARADLSRQGLSEFIDAICDYSFLYGAAQQQIVDAFLGDLLTHRDRLIRQQAATTMARLTIKRNQPIDYSLTGQFGTAVSAALARFLAHDVTTSELHATWLGEALPSFTTTLLKECTAPQQCLKMVLRAIEQFRRKADSHRHILAVVDDLPPLNWRVDDLQGVCQIVKNIAVSGAGDLKLEALYSYSQLVKKYHCNLVDGAIVEQLDGEFSVVNNYLTAIFNAASAQQYLGDVDINAMYLSNLNAATSRVVKLIQIEILMSLISNGSVDAFYSAMHFSNLLKVSDDARVRQAASKALLATFGDLTNGQKNDIAIELLLALEVQNYRFSRQIPLVLGQLIVQLAEGEFNAIVRDLISKVKSGNQKVARLILDTAATCLSALLQQRPNNVADSQLNALLKVVFNGLFHYDDSIARQAIRVLRRPLYDAGNSTAKIDFFGKIAKKLIVALARRADDYFGHLSKAMTLNYIYAFLLQIGLETVGKMLKVTQKVAFFPGTYDPFSRAHLKSATTIRDMGFEVYLAIDEFSWSKRTQPNQKRRKIIEMSVADEADIYVFPQNNIVNIANKNDLLNLKKIFANRQVYLVMGSDVLTHASAYQRVDVGPVINTFSHIVFRRSRPDDAAENQLLDDTIAKITGDVICLNLTPEVERISSTQIRNYIDSQRDISNLIEEKAQQYIYDTALYRHEPLFKDTLTVRSTGVTVTENIDQSLIAEIGAHFSIEEDAIGQLLANNASDQPFRLLQIRDISNNNKLIAFSLFHWLRSGMIYRDFPSDKISYYIRENAVGRIVVIDALVCQSNCQIANLEQVVLTETLAFSLAKDYSYAIYRNALQRADSATEQVLELQGFKRFCDAAGNCIEVVDMSDPIILNLDCKSMIKAPYRDALAIDGAIERARQKLQRALCRFKPGSLVLSFDRAMMYEHLIKKICDVNGVPTYQTMPRQLGANMCVTYGDLFKRWRIPNTVTKALHTERFYHGDFQSYDVENSPGYLDLDIQTKTIKSFERPVILVDDIFDKGYRLRGIMDTFNAHQVNVKKLVAAILTGRGKAWLEMNDIDVEWAYYIPKVRYWFNESMLYPFIGGDAVQGQVIKDSAALQTINQILPYVFPRFMRSVPKQRIADFSKSCLASAMIVLSALEDEYLKLNGRGLTLQDLNAVLLATRIPQQRSYLDYDVKRSPVDVLRADAAYLDNIIDFYGGDR